MHQLQNKKKEYTKYKVQKKKKKIFFVSDQPFALLQFCITSLKHI